MPKTPELGLVRYDSMCQAIATCHQVDEAKEIRDKARALEVYAAQALNTEAERKACEIRLRAERRTGELLKEMKQNGTRQATGGDKKSLSRSTTMKLPDIGITRDQSSKWQKLADIPQQAFEEALADRREKPTTEGILHRHCPEPMPEIIIDRRALEAWGAILRFSEDGTLKHSPCETYALMLPTQRADVKKMVPAVIAWLEGILECAETRKSEVSPGPKVAADPSSDPVAAAFR